MQPEGSVFEQKPVFDWNRVPVGKVTTTRKDPKTRDTRELVLTLYPAAQEELGVSEATFEVPARLVSGVRSDAVVLDRSLGELKKIEFFSSLVKK